MPHQISLSTDIGEGFGQWRISDDAALLGIVSAANVACGFHAGDPDIMRATCETAAANGVSVGAQVSYNDFPGFGRRFIDVDPRTLTNELLYQIGALAGIARASGTKVSFVRAHGALYNSSATVLKHAEAILDAVEQYDPTLPLICQAGTHTWRIADERGIRTVAEAFVDRAYTAEGLLVPRGTPGAMVTDPDEAAARAVRLVTEGRVTSIDGVELEIEAQTLLVHSDSDGAVELARATRAALEAAGVEIVTQR